MKRLILFATIIASSGVMLTNVYNSIVDAQAWGSNIPYSIEAARNYFRSVNPGTFYRTASPLLQLLALFSLVISWKSFRNLRWYMVSALLLFVLSDVLTFAYFYPRNDIMFSTAALSDIATLGKAHGEWSTMNWFRSVLVLSGVVMSCVSLHKSYAIETVQSGKSTRSKFERTPILAEG